ncbi:hypothetical protein ARMGADRAFT_1039055 [Armillaria gallica]|uniref:Uncharacterized protein n=1 Tax=Armillaria gallica TaxID=47427 RepID=A0A2H3CFL6_ARMGA|nr:hypothetical protein ARMGADRAFT_1039055 [Armillaria gallica]
MAIGNDLHDDEGNVDTDGDSNSATGDQHSEDDRGYNQQEGWQEVEFEEYPNYTDNEEVEFMGMMMNPDSDSESYSSGEYDGSSENEDGPEDAPSEGDDNVAAKYVTRCFTN